MRMVTATHKAFIRDLLPAPGRDGIALRSVAYNNLLMSYETAVAPQTPAEFSEEIELILKHIGDKGFAFLG